MNDQTFQPSGRRLPALFGGLFAALLLLIVVQTLLAQETAVLPPDLSRSAKFVDKASANAGETLAYTIVISNTGDQPAIGVAMTDTIPAGASIVSGTLAASEGLFGESNGVITWTGVINNNAEVTITFDATLTDTLTEGTVITNTAYITGDGNLIARSVETTIVESGPGTIYMAVIGSAPPTVNLLPIGRPGEGNQWTLNWTVSDDTLVTGYEIEQSQHPDFSDSAIIATANVMTWDITQSPVALNIWYYRVRALGSFGYAPWSNVQQVIGAYRDDFNDPSTNWEMRRQDTDTTANQVYYRDGHLVLEMDSGYDYQIAAPLAPAPIGSYRIEAQVRLVGVDNLHSYGIVFGGDWNGQTCPDATYSSCFNQYYRLNIIWAGEANNQMVMQLKRIDFHDADDNTGRGVDLIAATNVPVNSPPSGYQTWAVEVYTDGTIKVFVNGNQVGQAFDTTYLSRPYFAAFSSVDEYTGIEAEFDYYQVQPLDNP